MRINFRQGIVSHQTNFLTISGSGGSPVNVDLNTNTRAVNLTIAHAHSNYSFSEINSIDGAWSVPSVGSRWLYWDFNPLTFSRSFGTTDKQPVAQAVEPGSGDATIIGIIPGAGGIGSFIIDGLYSFIPGRRLVVSDTVASDGTYTVSSVSYDEETGDTTVVVNERVTTETGSPIGSPITGIGSPIVSVGTMQTDLDSAGNPLLVVGRHWYDTLNNRHYVRVGAGSAGTSWAEVLRVFAARVTNSVVYPMSITAGSFSGTQIGDTTSVLTGRPIFDESSQPIIRDNGTFFTTEDQFFSAAARIDAIRLEASVARARFPAANSGGVTISAYTVVSWVASGDAGIAEYDDIGNKVLGILTETVNVNEEAAVIIQGVVTNPDWAVNNWAINAPLWIDDNGELTDVNPHTTNVSQYPVSRVPVARVLDVDTIIFDQGLGGKGERGPQGDPGDVGVATTSTQGTVSLSTAPSNPDNPIAISDTDPRLSDAREPLEHTHTASDVTYVSNGCLSSSNVQDALTELCTEKVDVAGDTMEGFLTLSSNPTAEFHAATKQYVDGLVSGFVWLDAVCTINLIGDDVVDPSTIAGTVQDGDTYIVPSNAVGDWAALDFKNLVQWNENTNTWVDLGAPSDFSELRFGISFTSSTAASGSFAGLDNQIALFDQNNNFIGVETASGSPTNIPQVNNAVFVCAENDRFAFRQYVYDGTEWKQFGGLTVTTITTLETLTDTNFGGSPALTTGDLLKWNGSEWVNAPESENFSIISVAGQNDIVADNATDILTFEGGAGITITTNNTTDTITIIADTGSPVSTGDPNFVGENQVATPSATGTNSLAMGPNAIANGDFNISIGDGSYTLGTSAISVGRNSNAPFSHSIAIGTNADSLALSSITLGSAGTDNISADVGASGQRAIAIGYNSYSNSQDGVSIGPNSTANINPSNIAIGRLANAGQTSGADSCIAIGEIAFADASGSGGKSIAIGRYSDAIGDYAIAIGGANADSGSADASAADAIAIGRNSLASAADAVAIGPDVEQTSTGFSGGTSNTNKFTLDNSGNFNIPSGGEFTIGGVPLDLGGSPIASGDPNFVGENQSATPSATGTNSLAMGPSASATGTDAIAIGDGSISSGTDSIAVGRNTDAIANNAIAVGGSSVDANSADVGATGTQGIAIGLGSYANGSMGAYESNIAIGPYATADDSFGAGIAIGREAAANGFRSIAIGSLTVAGRNARATANDTIAIGADAEATIYGAMAIGSDNLYGPAARGARSIVLGGGGTTTLSADKGISIGRGTYCNATHGIAIGSGVNLYNSARVSGDNGISVGRDSNSSANNAIAIGYGSTASDTEAVAIGRNTDATGANSIAIGGDSTDATSADATANRTIAIGYNTLASAVDAVAIGTNVEQTAAGVSIGSSATNKFTLNSSGDFNIPAGGEFTIGGVPLDLGGIGSPIATVTFSTISVSGQSDVVADNASDTLTLVAGSNISITTDAGTDTITINSTAPTLTQEQVQDFAWGSPILTTGTQTLITVTYDDVNNNVDFVVDGDLSNYNNATSGFISDITNESLADLSDITYAGSPVLSQNDILVWDGDAWVNRAQTTLDIGNAFTTIAVAGQSDVVADNASDTLTFVAGSNISITTDAGTDTITINSTGGAGSPIASGDPNFVGENQAAAPSATGTNSLAMGDGASATSSQTIAIGYSANSSNFNSLAIGRSASTTARDAIAIGYNALASTSNYGPIAIGKNTDSSANYSIAIGAGSVDSASADATANNTVAIARNSLADATEAIAIGDSADASGIGGIAIGDTASSGATSGSDHCIAIGTSAIADSASGDAIAIGRNTDATGANSIAIGGDGTDASSADASGSRSIAVGYNSAATVASAVAIGYNTDSSNTRAVAIGTFALASGAGGIAIGSGVVLAGAPQATSDSSIAVGNGANATDSRAIAIGTQAEATNGQAIAIGQRATATGSSSIAMGSSNAVDTTAAGDKSIVFGVGATADQFGDGGVSIGAYSYTSSAEAIALGQRADATGANSIAIGGDGTDASSADALAANAIAIGYNSLSNSANAVAIGINTTTAPDAIAIGANADAASDDNIAIGTNATTSVADAIAIGQNANATGFRAIAIGGHPTDATSADATANRAIAIGYNTLANAVDAVAIGTNVEQTAAGVSIGSSNTNKITLDTNGDASVPRNMLADTFSERVNTLGTVSGTTDINLADGGVITATSVGSPVTAFTFSGVPSNSTEFTLILTNGLGTTWPGSVVWAGGTAPTLTAAGVDVLTFVSPDAGTTWYGFLAGAAMA